MDGGEGGREGEREREREGEREGGRGLLVSEGRESNTESLQGWEKLHNRIN